MNARVSINAQQRGSSPSKETSLRPTPIRKPLQLVETQGQVQIHTATFRGSFSITFAGNIGKSQNLEILVDSAHILKRKREKVKFVILGTGRNKTKLLQKVKAFNVEDYFLFLGRQEAISMPKYFKSSDVMLITLKKSKIFSYIFRWIF